MGADTQRFHESQLFEREPAGWMEPLDRHGHQAAHAAVGVDAEDLEILAAVVSSQPAHAAAAAAQVRLNGAAVAAMQAVAAGRHVEDFRAQLMAEDSGIAEKRLLAIEGVQIGAADADAVDAHQGFTGRRHTDIVRATDKAARFLKGDRSHVGSLYRRGSDLE